MMDTTCTEYPTIGTEEDLRRFVSEKVSKGDFKLPVLPQVATQVLTLSNSMDSELADLSALIHKDQALAGHVLRISNSILFAGSQTISSLQQAIARLGMQLIREIATMVGVKGEVFQASGFEKQVNEIWKHALASAGFGKEIARSIRANVESQFLGSLMHTVGKPIILQIIADLESEQGARVDPDCALKIAEELHLTIIDSAATKWNLPSQITACCKFSQNYASAQSYTIPAAMTYLSNILARHALDSQNCDEQSIRQDPVVAELNLYPEDVTLLLDKRTEVIQTVNTLTNQ